MYEIKKMLSGGVITNTPSTIHSQNKIFIFDMDGTIADLSHRIKYIEGEKKDWDRFFSECIKDEPIWPIIEVLQCISSFRGSPETEIWIVSGRSSVCALATVCWLEHYGIPYRRLFMRKEGDHRPDNQVKEEFLSYLSARTKESIRCVFDDRQQVVDMWRANGIKCCQVAEGNF